MDKLHVTVENGIKTLQILTGEALTPKEPTKVEIIGTIDAPLRWLQQRVAKIDKKQSHIRVDRERMMIGLIIDERDYYYTEIVGSLKIHPIYEKFGVNLGKYRTPFELAELIKMNRAHFENRQVAMELVSTLRQFKAKVDKTVEAEFNPNKGDKKLFYSQVIDSNLPNAFKLNIPLFKGQKPALIEVELYFNPDDLTCTLVSPEANESVEDTKSGCIDAVLEQIKTIAPDIAIIEM